MGSDTRSCTRHPGASRARTLIAAVLFAGGLLAVGHGMVIQRRVDGPSVWFRMSLDATKYIAMTEGQSLNDPLFSPRIAIPGFAALLPLPAHEALRLISYVSLAAMYILQWLLLRRLGFHWKIRLLSIGALFGTLTHMINYSNPFLTDAFALLVLTAMFVALEYRRDGLCAAMGLVCVLGRESCLCGLPAYAVRGRWGRLAGLLLVAWLVFATLRRWRFGGYEHPQLEHLAHWQYWAHASASFGFLWVPMLLGVGLVDWRRHPTVVWEALALGGGAIITSLMSSDKIRMIGILQVTAPVLWAAFLGRLGAGGRGWLPTFVCLVVAASLLAVPSVVLSQYAEGMTELEQGYFRLKGPIIVVQVAGLGWGLAAGWRLRRALWAGWRENLGVLGRGVGIMRSLTGPAAAEVES